MHQWQQRSSVEARTPAQEGLLVPNKGYKYETNDGDRDGTECRQHA